MKVKITSVIPVAQYANIQPEVEVEADTYEEGMAILEPKVGQLWDKYFNKVPTSYGTRKLIKAFVGGTVFYDELAHVYTNESGDVYLSGSQYAESFKKPFDGQAIAGKMGAKIGKDGADILEMWKLKGEASKNFGNAIHQAMQLYEQYRELSEALGKEYHIHDNFVLKDVCTSFYEAHKDEKALSEIVVVDHESKRAGQIDRLVVLGDKHGRVEDYKTGDVTKSLETYWKQLEFYGEILTKAGWKIDKPVIHGWNGEWKTYVPK